MARLTWHVEVPETYSLLCIARVAFKYLDLHGPACVSLHGPQLDANIQAVHG